MLMLDLLAGSSTAASSGSASCPLLLGAAASSSASSPRPTRGCASGSATARRAVSEPVVGAAIVRAYAVEGRTQQRIDDAIAGPPRAARSGPRGWSRSLLAPASSSAGLANAGRPDRRHLARASTAQITARRAARLPVPRAAVRRPGADRHRGAQRAAERHRRLAPGDRHPRHPGRRRRPRRRPASSCRAGRSPSLRARRASPTPAVRRCCATSTCDIAAGTRVAVVGETGSGKTTFAKLLTRLMDPAAGRCSLDGVDLRDVRFASLRERVVLVPQEGFLFDDTLRDNVALRPRPTRRDEEILLAPDRARPGRLARRPAARPRHAGRPARRVAVGRRAPAGRAGPGLPRRPRPAGARRGHLRRRPRHRDAPRARAGAA